jgi:hypothetical protein
MYEYYRGGEEMLENLLRDAPVVPIVMELMGAFRGLLVAAAEILIVGMGVRGRARRRTAAAIGHALDFSTWRSLVRGQGLDDSQAVELMSRFVRQASEAKG